jgi:hypothetical protein
MNLLEFIRCHFYSRLRALIKKKYGTLRSNTI